MLPVTSLAAGRDCAGLAVLGEACPGAQFMPAGHVASGFCSFERLGVAVCADAAPAKPYIVVYKVAEEDDQIVVLGIVHGAKDR